MSHANLIFFLSGAFLSGAMTAFAQLPPSPPPPDTPASAVLAVATRVEPEYSPEARAAGLQGTVLLTLEVAPDGTVREVHVRRGLGLGLDEKAVAAAKQWQYKPFNSNGRSLLDVVEIPFQLEPRGPWRIVGSSFFFPLLNTPRSGPRVKPILSRFVSPDAGACSTDLVYVPVNLAVGKDGRPNEVRVESTIDGSIGKAATDAVQSWQFQPGTIGGQAEVSPGTILLECRNPGAPSGAEAGIYRVGGGVSPPTIIFKVDPEYSEAARKAKLSGSVTLSVIVDTEGRAQNIR